MLYFANEDQVRLYRSTVITLLKNPTPAMRGSEVTQVGHSSRDRHSHVWHDIVCVPQMVVNFDAKTRDSKGAPVPARESYMAEYEEELRLNKEFDKFVANFQLAYEGPNTARDQIPGAKYDTRELVSLSVAPTDPPCLCSVQRAAGQWSAWR